MTDTKKDPELRRTVRGLAVRLASWKAREMIPSGMPADHVFSDAPELDEIITQLTKIGDAT